MKRLIDLMIIGAQKAGSTSMKQYLDEHPQLFTHPHIEFTYFVDNTEYDKGYKNAYKKYFFNKNLKATEKLIAKNVTLSYREYGLERLAKHNPQCHIVFILRNPVDRAYSAYQMAVRGGWLNQPFSFLNQAIENHRAGEKDYFYRFLLDLGIYYPQIETVRKYFPESQVHIYLYEDLKTNPNLICQEVYRILDVDTEFQPNTNKKHNEGGVQKSKLIGLIIKFFRKSDNPVKSFIKKLVPEKSFLWIGKKINKLNTRPQKYDSMSDELRQILIEFYKPYNKKCSDLIGLDLSLWDK